MKEMSAVGGGGFGMQNMPDTYNVVVNSNHKLISKILKSKGAKKKSLVQHSIDLALISQNLLKGKALTNYINRNFEDLGV